jgi:hypothetical protein
MPLPLVDRFLVALVPVCDLLLFAKNLFVAAKIVWPEVQLSRGEREAKSAVVGPHCRSVVGPAGYN